MGQTISYHATKHDLDLGEKGVVRGLQFDKKARRYVGIPYALPPTGARRWRKPVPLPQSYKFQAGENGGPYDATKFKDVCSQAASRVGEIGKDPNTYSEDCLYVNIWTPVPNPTQPTKKWPVQIWLHGGWFQIGEPSQNYDMDATELISTGGLDSIVVAVGYRLNVFGFLAGNTLLEESGRVSAGNFGLWDQRLAIEWVKTNIGLFNGDSDNITLAGRSAGAYSVEAQMLYDFRSSADQTFHRVFMSSNAIPAQPKGLKDVDAQFDELCGYFGIDTKLSGQVKLDKLRELSSDDLVASLGHLQSHTFRPVTDVIFFKPGMYEYLQSKTFATEFLRRDYRMLIGEVHNEETLYSTYNSPEKPTLEALKLQVSNYYSPELTERILEQYELPETDDLEEWKNCFGRIISDGQVRAPSRVLLRALVDHGVPLDRIWRYEVAYRMSFITEDIAPKSFGVAHAMDRPIWNFSLTHGPTETERVFLTKWIDTLVAFVKNDLDYDHGTRTVREVVMATPEARMEVRLDPRWDRLVKLGEIFGSS